MASLPDAAAVATAQGGGIAARLRQAAAATAAASTAHDLSLPPPPYPPLIGWESGSFAHATITSRLPAILESMIQDVQAEAGEASGTTGGVDAGELSACLAELRALREAMLADAPLSRLEVPGAPEETQILLDSANAALELAVARQAAGSAALPAAGKESAGPPGPSAAASPPSASASPSGGRPTWLGLPWLTVECYMYAAVHAALQRRHSLAGSDPFHRQKAAAWAKSAGAAADMAAEVEMLLQTLHAPSQQPHSGGGDGAQGSEASAAGSAVAARLAALAGMRIALWGNKADLSLLAGAAGLEEHHLAAPPAPPLAGAAAAADGGGADGTGVDGATVPASRIIVDEGEAVWEVMARVRERRAAAGCGGGGGGVRVDIVLDNSGLELFADLCLADLLMEAGVADTVVLHGKAIPWFVSDTLAGDLEGLLASCEAERPPGAQLSPAAWEPVRRLAARWRRHLTSAAADGGGGGGWRWAAHPFWTTPAPFAWMAALAPDLYDDLGRSDLVIFKGDLNYRKLTHDCRWPHTTPFQVSLQGFAPAPLVALRTLKADVAVGLAPGLGEALSGADPDWLVNGKWGMVQAAL